VWWADLGSPRGSAPALRRPVVVVSADFVNRSAIRTVSVVGLTSNVRWAGAPGNVLIAAGIAGLPQESIANVTQLQTIERSDLDDKLGKLPRLVMRDIDAGLRRVLDL
jgi:mRNA interferase MazF